MSILNAARSGKFSSDRAMREYVQRHLACGRRPGAADLAGRHRGQPVAVTFSCGGSSPDRAAREMRRRSLSLQRPASRSEIHARPPRLQPRWPPPHRAARTCTKAARRRPDFGALSLRAMSGEGEAAGDVLTGAIVAGTIEGRGRQARSGSARQVPQLRRHARRRVLLPRAASGRICIAAWSTSATTSCTACSTSKARCGARFPSCSSIPAGSRAATSTASAPSSSRRWRCTCSPCS